jgi:hypothetical protein
MKEYVSLVKEVNLVFWTQSGVNIVQVFWTQQSGENVVLVFWTQQSGENVVLVFWTQQSGIWQEEPQIWIPRQPQSVT